MAIPQILDLLPLPFSETGVFLDSDSDVTANSAAYPLNSLHTLNEALNIATPTSAAAWDLSVPEYVKNVYLEDFTVQPLLYRRGHSETLLEPFDVRFRVDKADYAPGGRFEAICKLFLRYSNSESNWHTSATGWLITLDVIVTAGHCAYDWSYGLGHLVEAKVYIRYAGKESVDSGESELRYGKYVTVPTEYLKGPRD
ncbi:hypothetical protein TWF481_007610 [Arthrobotrys musiformis]|uniref:Peptidase S1 domain-containing protein n=1 Tax=Arthrobotrys musiformis TaxID=47236 RepID=A0AAV9WBY8_9PEZI